MFKKLLLTVLVLGFMVGISNACVGPTCDSDGNVRYDGAGNKGYILTYNCNNGNNAVGTWTDPSSLKGEKGDKGDKGDKGEIGAKGDKGDNGATGSQGIQGVAGKDGINGLNGRDGVDGLNGTNGIDGQDGQNGINGTDGKNGENGSNGQDGVNGTDGQNGEQGIQGLTGQQGETGKEGKQGIQGEKGEKGDTGKGLENRVELIGEVRVFDTRKWSGFIYSGVDINNKTGIAGVKVQYKMGTSYEEREIQKLNTRLDKMEANNTSIPNNAELYTNGTITGIRTKF